MFHLIEPRIGALLSGHALLCITVIFSMSFKGFMLSLNGTQLVDECWCAARFSDRYQLLLAKICLHIHFYDEVWWKTAHFELCLLITAMSTHAGTKSAMPIVPLGPKPTHSGNTCTGPYLQHIMYPSLPPAMLSHLNNSFVS